MEKIFQESVMNNIEPISNRLNANTTIFPVHTIPIANVLPYTSFNRCELNAIFSLYGTKVACGEWRDYSIDFLKDRAVFSIFRRASERPLYRIEKIRSVRENRALMALWAWLATFWNAAMISAGYCMSWIAINSSWLLIKKGLGANEAFFVIKKCF